VTSLGLPKRLYQKGMVLGIRTSHAQVAECTQGATEQRPPFAHIEARVEAMERGMWGGMAL